MAGQFTFLPESWGFSWVGFGTTYYYPFRESGILRCSDSTEPFIGATCVATGRMNCPVNKVSGIFAFALMLFSSAGDHLHATETEISINTECVLRRTASSIALNRRVSPIRNSIAPGGARKVRIAGDTLTCKPEVHVVPPTEV